MSQHDMDVSRLDTNTGTGVRQGLNDALKALASNSSGPSEPGTPYAFQWWADEASGWMKIRNAANTAWIAMFPLAYAVIPMTEEGDIVYGGADGVPTRLAKGYANQVLRINAAGTVPEWATAAGGGSAQKWTQLTVTEQFATTAPSSSTITMAEDFTDGNEDGNGPIRPGMPIKFKLSGSYYYALCTSITTTVLTIAGAPLTTGAGALTELYYSDLPGQVIPIQLTIPGYFADASESALLSNDNYMYIKWMQSKAYLVLMSAVQKVIDTGSQNTINCAINSNNVFSTPLTLSGTGGTWVDTVVALTTANYDVNYSEAIEIGVTKAGNGDCRDLSVILVFVGE